MSKMTAPRATKRSAANGRPTPPEPTTTSGPTTAEAAAPSDKAIRSDFVARTVRQAIAHYHETEALVEAHKAVMQGIEDRGGDLGPFRPWMLMTCLRAYAARGHLIEAILERSYVGDGKPFGVLCDAILYIACRDPKKGDDDWLLITLAVNGGFADVDEFDRSDDEDDLADGDAPADG